MKQNLAQATKRAVQNSNLDALDAFGSGIDDFKATSELSVIEEVIGEFIKTVKQNMQEKDMIVTGKIEDITVEKAGSEIHIKAPNYLAFQDKGVNGAEVSLYDTPYKYKEKKPPYKPILDWVIAKGLAEGDEAKGMAYAIQNKIYNEGLEPTKVYSRELPALANSLAKHIAGFTIKNILDRITTNEQTNGNK